MIMARTGAARVDTGLSLNCRVLVVLGRAGGLFPVFSSVPVALVYVTYKDASPPAFAHSCLDGMSTLPLGPRKGPHSEASVERWLCVGIVRRPRHGAPGCRLSTHIDSMSSLLNHHHHSLSNEYT